MPSLKSHCRYSAMLDWNPSYLDWAFISVPTDPFPTSISCILGDRGRKKLGQPPGQSPCQLVLNSSQCWAILYCVGQTCRGPPRR